MKIATTGGYEIHIPMSGGKAGKGRNKTSTLQIRHGNQIVKQIRFNTADLESSMNAARKAKQWINENPA